MQITAVTPTLTLVPAKCFIQYFFSFCLLFKSLRAFRVTGQMWLAQSVSQDVLCYVFPVLSSCHMLLCPDGCGCTQALSTDVLSALFSFKKSEIVILYVPNVPYSDRRTVNIFKTQKKHIIY